MNKYFKYLSFLGRQLFFSESGLTHVGNSQVRASHVGHETVVGKNVNTVPRLALI